MNTDIRAVMAKWVNSLGDDEIWRLIDAARLHGLLPEDLLNTVISRTAADAGNKNARLWGLTQILERLRKMRPGILMACLSGFTRHKVDGDKMQQDGTFVPPHTLTVAQTAALLNMTRNQFFKRRQQLPFKPIQRNARVVEYDTEDVLKYAVEDQAQHNACVERTRSEAESLGLTSKEFVSLLKRGRTALIAHVIAKAKTVTPATGK